MNRRARRIASWPGVALVLALAHPGAAQGGTAAEPAPAPLEIPLPEVELAALEPAVAEQLARLSEYVDGRRADPAISTAELAEAIGELGRHYHAYDLRQPARACYELARGLAPEDFRWPYLMAYLDQAEGRLEAAVAGYRRALEIFAQATPAWIRLGETYASLGRRTEAEAAYAQALEIEPDSAAALAGAGQLLLDSGRPREAADHLERALAAVPGATRLYYPLARAYQGLGEEEKARALLAQRGPVGVRPADPVIDELAGLTTGERVHLLRGHQAYRAGRWAEAAEEFGQAVAANPDAIGARLNLGAALGQLGETERAIAALAEVVERAPGNAQAHFNLAALYARRGERPAALVHWQEAVLYAPDDGEARLQLALALEGERRWDEALVHYARAVVLLPEDDDRARLGEVRAHLARREYHSALGKLEAGLEAVPGSSSLAELLAGMLAVSPDLELRDGERAVELAERLLLERQGVSEVDLLAAALAEAGRCAEAAKWIATVLEQAPEGFDPRRRGQLESALAHYSAGPPCRPPGPRGVD